MKAGDRVAVRDSRTGHVLFTGTLRDGVPWQFWHRVEPDQPHVDLPPMYEIEPVPPVPRQVTP